MLESPRPVFARLASLVLLGLLALPAAHCGPGTPTFTVNTLLDRADAAPGDGACDDGAGSCSLRAAIQETNALGRLRKVRLGAGLYVLGLAGASEDAAATGDLDLTGRIRIVGLGADRTAIDAQGLDRVFHVLAGADATLKDLQVVGGSPPDPEDGGGILVEGDLVLERVSVAGNQSAGDGGGLRIAEGGSLTLLASAIAWNQAGGNGGGISSQGQLDAESCTFGRNRAGGSGGGLHQGPDAIGLIAFCSLGFGEARVGGNLGGSLATLSLQGSIVAYGSGGDCAGVPASLGYNLASDASCDLTQTGDQQGVDPQLMGLGVYDGKTPAFALRSGSPAEDSGPGSGYPQLDQYGKPRLQGGGSIDVGALGKVPFPTLIPFTIYMGGAPQGGGGAVLFRVNSATLQGAGSILLGTGDLPVRVVRHPTMKLVAVVYASRIELWNVANVGKLWTWNAPLGQIEDVVFHPDGTKLWVPEPFGSCIWSIDTSTGVVDDCLLFTSNPSDIAILPNGAKAYVSHWLEDKVSVFDLGLKTVVTQIPITASSLQPSPTFGFLYALDIDQGQIEVVNTTLDVVALTSPPVGSSGGLLVDPTGQRVYHRKLGFSYTLDVFDALAQPNGSLTLPDGAVASTVHPYGNTVYVAQPKAAANPPFVPLPIPPELLVVDIPGLQITDVLPVAATAGPNGVAVR